MGHAIAKTYTIKDRVMDDERIKRGTYLTDKYCKEQLERIRDVSQNSKPHEPFPFCGYISVSCKKESVRVQTRCISTGISISSIAFSPSFFGLIVIVSVSPASVKPIDSVPILPV